MLIRCRKCGIASPARKELKEHGSRADEEVMKQWPSRWKTSPFLQEKIKYFDCLQKKCEIEEGKHNREAGRRR